MGRLVHRRTAVLMVTIGLLAFVPSPTRAQLDTCRITQATGSVFTALNEGGAALYYGHALMSTEGCGRGPVTIEATFRPVTGEPTSCSPISSVFIGEAACTYAYAATVVGTQVVIEGVGKASGTGGVDTFRSSCTVIVPFAGRASCRFPLG